MEAVNIIASVDEFFEAVSSVDANRRETARFCALPDDIWLDYIDTPGANKVDLFLNKRLGIEVLRKLASDEDAAVRERAASVRKVGGDPQLAKSLSIDTDAEVRCSLARNPKIEIDLLRKIADSDPDDYVREQAREALQKRLA